MHFHVEELTYLLAKMMAMLWHVENVISSNENEDNPGTVKYSSECGCNVWMVIIHLAVSLKR